MYTPAVNYNTEFPQLGSAHRPQISTEHQPRPLPQHLSGPWPAPSTPTGIGYGHPETMMSPFNPNHVGARSTSTLYLPSSQYPCQRPGMPFIHPHEHVHQPFSQVWKILNIFPFLISLKIKGPAELLVEVRTFIFSISTPFLKVYLTLKCTKWLNWPAFFLKNSLCNIKH